ncbi:MAG: glycosyltransferase, partial [Bacteroidales bacterium]|nr:glycosyltransferase [Bacteroidales bacterium]
QKGKLKRLVELHKVLKSEKPNIVYTWGNGESVSILLLKPFHNFKFINGSIRHGIRSKRFSHYFRTVVLHLSQNIVANSKAGLKANNFRKGSVLYNGIEDKFFQPLINRSATRQKLTGIPDNIPLIVSVANLVPYKDYFSVLDALKDFKVTGHNFFYLILGDGPMRLSIEDKIASHNLQHNVRIVGNVENVSDYLKVSDIFIHSSKGEGCSNAILEAMAAGLPIIASNTGGTSEIVTSECGMLFDYKNAAFLNGCIASLIEDSEKRVQFGKNSYDNAIKNFTMQRMMIEYYQIIESL